MSVQSWLSPVSFSYIFIPFLVLYVPDLFNNVVISPNDSLLFQTFDFLFVPVLALFTFASFSLSNSLLFYFIFFTFSLPSLSHKVLGLGACMFQRHRVDEEKERQTWSLF